MTMKPSAGQAVVLWSLVLLSILILVIVLTQTRLSTVSSQVGVTHTGTTTTLATDHMLPSGSLLYGDYPRWDCKTMGNKICGYAGNLGFTCPTGNGNRTPQELDLCPPNS